MPCGTRSGAPAPGPSASATRGAPPFPGPPPAGLRAAGRGAPAPGPLASATRGAPLLCYGSLARRCHHRF
ncbi:hypothetical protein [Roseiflexus castenholzii]|uniref:hypothetical protein n=1 Tax=Roseiflexus castenholzii TaxID=120962 RepID=UPI0018DE177D|nr:hypothetical protein [Roseiflexus castenholzii]